MEIYLTRVTDYLLTQSWQIALLVVVIAAVSLVLRNKSAHVRYLLWLIVLAKCLVPPLLTVPVAILPQEKPAMVFEAVGTTVSEPLELLLDPVKTAPASMVRERPTKINIREWLGAGWIVGAIAFLVFNLLKALRASLWLWRQRKPLPAELLSDIENLFSAHCIKSSPGVWQVDGISQPFVWGLLRGSIYLPADLLSLKNSKRCKSLLGHELSHIIRFDAAVNFLQVIVQAIFWFHPFVWWANRKIRAEREKCCDEMAIARLNASPRDYSTAIVETLAAKHESVRPVPSLAVAGPVSNIEERIKTMMRPGKKFYKRPSLVATTTILLAALLTVPTALVLTARAQTKSAEEQKLELTKSIYYAASTGDIEQVKLHISKGTDVNEKTTTGDTPLHYAVRYGHEDVAKLLIAKGAHVNERNAEGDTPLHFAAKYGHKNVAVLLIKKGADVNAKNKNGDLPTHLALRGNLESRKKEVLELLIAKGPSLSCIQISAHQGDLAKVRNFVEQGIDVDSRDSEGRTALHYAAIQGKRDVVEFLLSRGADVNAKDKDYGFIPLHHASSGGYKDVVELLIAKGADVNAKDKHGWTPLDSAAYYGQKDVVELLIRAGADVNSKYGWGETPLIWAAQTRHTAVADLLIVKGADVNAQDDNGFTPLHYAVMRGHENMVKLFIAKGADVNARDARGRGHFWQAKNRGHKEIVELLRKHGAKE